MAILYAKIGADWVPVGGGSGGGGTAPNEVFVGPDDPIATYPEAELWYDSDAVALPTGGLPAGMRAYGPFTTPASAVATPQGQAFLTYTHNLNLPDPAKCVVAAHTMEGSWASAGGWRAEVTTNTVIFTILNLFAAGGPNIQVVFRFMIFQGA